MLYTAQAFISGKGFLYMSLIRVVISCHRVANPRLPFSIGFLGLLELHALVLHLSPLVPCASVP